MQGTQEQENIWKAIVETEDHIIVNAGAEQVKPLQ